MPEPADNPHAFSADGITLRAELPSDGPFLFALYAGTRQAELDLTGWNAATREAFLQMQFRAMRAGYAQTYPKAAFSLILRTGVPIGRQVIDRTEECLRVADIAL